MGWVVAGGRQDCGVRWRLGTLPGGSGPHTLPSQVCIKREKRVADTTLEKYVLTVVLDTINAFFSSPFSENSTSLQVRLDWEKGRSQCLFMWAREMRQQGRLLPCM